MHTDSTVYHSLLIALAVLYCTVLYLSCSAQSYIVTLSIYVHALVARDQVVVYSDEETHT